MKKIKRAPQTKKTTIPKELIKKTRKWLGKNGIAFFKEMKEKHDGYSPVFMVGDIPYPVHFREGMQVRNFMRNSGLCDEWTCHELDDNWIHLIEKVMENE